MNNAAESRTPSTYDACRIRQPMRLATLAPLFERQTEESEQDSLLIRTAESWSQREHCHNEEQMIKGLEQDSVLFFLAQLLSYLKRPYFRFSKACVDRLLHEISNDGVDPLVIHELAYCARVSATSFRFWESVVERMKTASPDQLMGLARLLDSEDAWGQFSSVDIRLRAKLIWERRFLETGEPSLEKALAECLVFDRRTHPQVVAKAKKHIDPRIRELCKLGQSMPLQVHPWWTWHFAGSNTFVTGVRVRPPRWTPRLRRWVGKALAFPRLRLFCCFLFEVMTDLNLQEEDFEALLACYYEARDGKVWCCFGSRMGHWSGVDWAKFLFRHCDSERLTRLFLESEPARWPELRQSVHHNWVHEDFPDNEEFVDFLTVLQASGAIVYDLHQGEPRWRGLVGESWPSPPLDLSGFLGQDKTGVVGFPSEDGENVMGAIAHFSLGERRGVFCFRRLYAGDSESSSGLFRVGEIELGKSYRDKILLRTGSSDGKPSDSEPE